MHIQINTADELTDQDRAILLALAGVTETSSGVLLAEEAKPETPKKRAPRKPKVVEQPTEEALDEAVDEAIEKHSEEDTTSKYAIPPEPEEPKETPTLDEVANVATAFIRNGKRDEVAKILNEDLGVEKVTALKDSPEKVPELFDRLVDLYNVQNLTSRKAVRQQITEDAAPLFVARTEV